MMKITKRQLRRIVREEKRRALNESMANGGAAFPGLGFGAIHRDPLAGFPKGSGFSLKEMLDEPEVPAEKAPVVSTGLEVTDGDYAQFVDSIKMGYGWIDPDYVATTWENMFGRSLSAPALEYLKYTLESEGLVREDTGEDW